VLYFGQRDGWVNDADADHIRGRFPAAQWARCTEGHPHAFVLTTGASRRLAELVWGFIREDVVEGKPPAAASEEGKEGGCGAAAAAAAAAAVVATQAQ
jgi:hypothetical protein